MNTTGIIKALECFAIDKDFDESRCIGCAFETKSICCENASDGIARKALHTIKCQQAEIERLQKYNTEIAFKHYNDSIKDFVNKYKSEINDRYEDIAYKDLFFKVIDDILNKTLKMGDF